MSNRIPVDYCEVWTEFRAQGLATRMFTALGLQLDPGTPPSTTLTNAISQVMTDHYKTFQSSAYETHPGYVLYGTTGADFRIDATTTPATGTGAATGLPPNVAALVAKRTQLGGRRGRGRAFIPGLPEGNVDSHGLIVSGTITAMQTVTDDMLADLIALATVIGPVLLHDTAPFTPTPISQMVVQAQVATQRRRLRK